MRIRAIRVAECGRFADPVALEGLSGGLDLLVAPNEAGKSTLVKALHLALFTKHSSKNADLERLRPYRGGAPLVEVDLEVDGELWRIRKRFLAGRMAEVASLSTGTLARGADAEARLDQLLGVRGPAGRSLVWLRQGEGMRAEPPDETGEALLRTAITREIAVTAGGDRLRQLRLRVQAALGEHVTLSRAQARGRYQAAGKALQVAESELAEARAAYAAAEALLDRLVALAAAAGGDKPQQRQALVGQVAAAEGRLKQAREDCAGRDRERLAVAEVRARHGAAAAAARALEEALDEIARLGGETAADAEALSKARAGLDAAEARWEAASTGLAAARAAQQVATLRLKAGEAWVRRRSLEQRALLAQAAADRVRALAAALDGLPLDPVPIKEARRLAAAIAEATARLEAAAPTVTVAYEPGAAGRIQVVGRPVEEGHRLVADGPLVLEIAGIGRITVEPGASVDRRRFQEARTADRVALDGILVASRAADHAGLERAHEEARRLAAELATAQAELEAHAGGGLAQLEAALRAASDGCEAPADRADLDPAALASEVADLEAKERAAQDELRRVDADRQELRREVAVLVSRVAERERRLAGLDARLPPADRRGERRAELRGNADAESAALSDALRIASAWEARAPDADGLARLEAEVEAARTALQRSEQQAAALAAERARIEGALQASRWEDVTARVAACEAEVDRARTALADIEEEVAALRLLEAELAAAEAGLEDRYLAPVSARLAPYVELVFPGAMLALGSGYGAEGLIRGLQREAIAQLSDGTREQIAVLARLAYARLLADQGAAVPLLLDDALVYADDHRIAAMHRALEAAAVAHQVIVLTCREQSFAGLGANRVSLARWDADAALLRTG